MRHPSPLVVGMVLLVAACEPRLIENPSLPGSVLFGTMVTDPIDDPGPTVVLLQDGDNPMPPEGVGLPISFSGVSADAWSPQGEGALGASFAFNGVEPGTYALSAVLDNDRNFHPEVTALATPTCGDRIGWHRETALGGGGVVAVTVGEQQVVDNVLVGPLEEVTEPNPVFTVTGDRTFRENGTYTIEAQGLSVEFGTAFTKQVPLPTSTDPCRAGFRYIRLDRDGDGDVDSLPLLPLPLLDDAWPIFIFEFLGTPVDTLGDGIPDDFVREDEFPDDFIVAIATARPVVNGQPLDDASLPGPNVPLDTATLIAELTQLAIRIDGEGTLNLTEVASLPPGAYGIRLITEQGQLWTLPNELDDRLAMSRNLAPPGLTLGAVAHQGVYLTK